jgi:hypothetical protein
MSEEVAASLHRTQGGGAALVEPEGAHHHAGQAIDRRAFLGAGGKVDAT